MHFCFIGQYAPEAVKTMMDNPDVNRRDAMQKLIEAAGGKLVSMYNLPADGPGVLVIFDVPDPDDGPAIVAVIVASGAAKQAKLMPLLTGEEVTRVRHKAKKLRDAYLPPTKG